MLPPPMHNVMQQSQPQMESISQQQHSLNQQQQQQQQQQNLLNNYPVMYFQQPPFFSTSRTYPNLGNTYKPSPLILRPIQSYGKSGKQLYYSSDHSSGSYYGISATR
jgi:hypothetical protein